MQLTLFGSRHNWLVTEFVLLFIFFPVSLYFLRHEFAPYLLIGLTTIFAWCLLLLLSDKSFKRFRLTNMKTVQRSLPLVLRVFMAAATVITIVTWWLTPEQFFLMPLQQTWIWLTLLVLYPVLSAWPQEVIFRTFLFHRYKHVFPKKRIRAILSAGSFALAHLLFANWIAVVGSFIAGLVFSATYIKSRSTLLVAIEHSLWGCWLFTAGLGSQFDSTKLF